MIFVILLFSFQPTYFIIMKQIIYKGTLYDISAFLPHHPGGQQIIEQYLTINNNITEVFK